MEHDISQRELMEAGDAVDNVIRTLGAKNLPPIAVASALLGGALNVLSRTLPDDAVVQILNHAIASVENGDLREADKQLQ
ncbi:MAG TPA: hypothetical protein VFN77_03815 [Acetobacteraceae bacterium]|jgi:hypothetical protein|nr:hypothetical protein [Acetobacteraceae bacterium]